MSRHKVEHQGKIIYYGLDSFFGYFYDVFESEDDDMYIETANEIFGIESRDKISLDFSYIQMAEKLKEINAPEEHISKVLNQEEI